MLIDGENTLLSDPDREHCEHALRSLAHLVVIDIFLTETAELADIVLPATAWGETDGVCTNTERRGPTDARTRGNRHRVRRNRIGGLFVRLHNASDLKGLILTSRSRFSMNSVGFHRFYAGLDWERIDKSEYQWPVPHKEHSGTPRLHEESFVNGRGIFSNVHYRDPAETISEEFPVWLTTGRRLQSYHTRNTDR